jgi:hypothetical protein
VKFAFVFVVVVVYSVNCQFVAASNSTASDKVAQSLHSELKYVESEIKRVWLTIGALEDEIYQNPDAITDETNKSLADLYSYDCELSDYLGKLEIELSQRDNPSGTIFTKDQFKPIHVRTMIHRVPPDAIPVLDGSKIAIKKRGL